MKVHPDYKKEHLAIAIAAVLLSIIAVLAFPYLGVSIDAVILIGIWAIAILAMGAVAANKKFINVEIEDDHVTLTRGIFSTKSVMINYNSITDIHVTRDFLDRILHLGSIEINTAGTTSMELRVSGLPNTHIDDLLNKAKRKK